MPRILPSAVDSDVKMSEAGNSKQGVFFSKTLSKTILLNKIKAALGKQTSAEGGVSV